MTGEWLDFVVGCSHGKKHDYNLVDGSIADDIIYNFIRDLEKFLNV